MTSLLRPPKADDRPLPALVRKSVLVWVRGVAGIEGDHCKPLKCGHLTNQATFSGPKVARIEGDH